MCSCAHSLVPTTFLPLRILSLTSLLGIMSSFVLLAVIIADGTIKREAPGSLWDVMPTSIGPRWQRFPLSFGLLMSGVRPDALFRIMSWKVRTRPDTDADCRRARTVLRSRRRPLPLPRHGPTSHLQLDDRRRLHLHLCGDDALRRSWLPDVWERRLERDYARFGKDAGLPGRAQQARSLDGGSESASFLSPARRSCTSSRARLHVQGDFADCQRKHWLCRSTRSSSTPSRTSPSSRRSNTSSAASRTRLHHPRTSPKAPPS